MNKDHKTELVWLGAFTGVFAVLAAYVFWGTWSSDVAPVMPDDSVWHPIAYAEQFAGFVRRIVAGEAFSPIMVFWNGALPQYGIQEFKYVVGLFLSGLALAYFLRELGLSRLASYGAGLLLGFCGYWMTLYSAGHGGWFIIMPFVVLAFAFMDRVAKSGRIRDGLLLGACVGWGACHQADLFLLFAEFHAVYGIFTCVRERKFPWKAGLTALMFFAIIGGPGIRGAFTGALTVRDKQIEESKGTSLAGGRGNVKDGASAVEKAKADAEARWIFTTNWSMPPEDTLEFFIPRIHGDTSCPMTLQLGRAAGKDVKPYTGRLGRPLNAKQGNYRQHSLYVGWVTCLLALLGVAVPLFDKRRGRRFPLESNNQTIQQSKQFILFFAMAAVVVWLFSLGRYCAPVYRIVYALPFGDYLRAPVKWHHLTEFCLCILAGFGIDALFVFLKEKGLKVRTAFVIVVALVLVGAADLAKNDKLYCAPIDLRIVTGRNAAADEILRRGKGTVCDLVEGGQGLLSWSFAARGVGVTRDLASKDARFVLVGTDQANRNPQIAQWLKQKAAPVGMYLLTREGFRAAPPTASNVALYQVNGVPAPPETARPPVNVLSLALAILSLLGTATAGVSLFRR